MKQPLEELIPSSIERKIFPGAVLGITDPERTLYLKAFGTTRYDLPGSVPVGTNFIYDCASLTKSIPTASLILKLAEEKLLSLLDPVQKFIPSFRGAGKSHVTIRDFLINQKPLRIRVSDFKDLDADDIWEKVFSAPLDRSAEKSKPANAPYLILGKIIEKVTSEGLDQTAAEIFWEPLGMEETTFVKPVDQKRTAPSEIDLWRGKIIHGEVHDETAWKLGEAVGSSGVFSTVLDLLNFAKMILNEGSFEKKQILKPSTVKFFSQGYGWEAKNPVIFGKYHPDFFGKTGFTGTFFAINLKRNLGVVFLSNSTFPKRPTDRGQIKRVRRTLCDLIAELA